jgi:hypothetical protein
MRRLCVFTASLACASLLERVVSFTISGVLRISLPYLVLELATRPLTARSLVASLPAAWIVIDPSAHPIVTCMFAMRLLSELNRGKVDAALHIALTIWSHPHQLLESTARVTFRKNRPPLWPRKHGVVAHAEILAAFTVWTLLSLIWRIAYSPPYTRVALALWAFTRRRSADACNGRSAVHHGLAWAQTILKAGTSSDPM